jgi:ribosomal protein S18 acetylase RimI-like enzyme
MTNSTIRQATAADVSAIVDLNAALFQEDAGQRDRSMNLAWPSEHGQDYFAKLVAGDTNLCLVAINDGTVVGYLVGYTREPSDIRPSKMAELESIFIRAEWRSSGIGADLVRTFVEWAKGQGARGVHVTAYAANERAIQFYRRAGFTPYHVTLELKLT